MKLLFLIQFILFFAFSSFASIKPKLIGRTHINKPGYNLPGYSTITNSSPQINNSGDILINLTSTNNSSQPGLWLKRAHDLKGKTIVLGRENEFFSSPSFNKDLQIVYHHYTDGDTYGIKKYQFDDDKITSIISLEQLPLTTSFSFPQINLQNHVLFRSLNNDGKRSIVTVYQEQIKTLLAENEEIKYIFTPNFNDKGSFAVKLLIEDSKTHELYSEIKVYDSSGFMRTIDSTKNKSSKYIDFNNSVYLNSKDTLLYIGVNNNHRRELILYSKQKKYVIAKEGSDTVSQIESFLPKVNSKNDVVFRATNRFGRRTIYAFSNFTLIPLLQEGDKIPCDLDSDCYVTLKEGFPGISGNLDLNDSRHLVGHIVLSNKDMTRYFGEAIYEWNLNFLDKGISFDH